MAGSRSNPFVQIIIIVQLFISCPVSGQDLQSVIDSSLAHFANDNFDGAAEQVRAYMEVAERLHHQNKSDTSLAIAIGYLAYYLHQAGKYHEATGWYEKCIMLRKERLGTDHVEYWNALDNYATLLIDISDYDQSSAYLDTLFSIIRTHKVPDHEISAYINTRAILYFHKNDYHRADSLFNYILNFDRKKFGEQSSEYAVSLNNLGFLYYQMANYRKAEKLYLESYDIRVGNRGPSHSRTTVVISNLGALYHDMGRYEEADSLYRMVLERYSKIFGKKSKIYAESINNLGVLFQETDQDEKALQIHLEVLKIWEELGLTNQSSFGFTLHNLGHVYTKLGQFDLAESYLKQCLSFRKQLNGNLSTDYAHTLQKYGQLCMYTSKFGKAADLFDQSAKIFLLQYDSLHPDYAHSLMKYAIATIRHDQDPKSIETFARASKLLLNHMAYSFAFISERDKRNFWNSFKAQFKEFNGLLLYTTDSVLLNKILIQVFNNQLNTKGILFNASKRIRTAIKHSNDVELEVLVTNLANTQQELSRATFLNADQRRQKHISLKNIRNRVRQLEVQISSKSEQFSRNKLIVDYSWQDVKQRLQYDEVVVEIIRMETHNVGKDKVHYVAIIVDATMNEDPKVVMWSGPMSIEDQLFKQYQKSLNSQYQDSSLYKILWGKIGDAIKSKKKVFVSADGLYHLINLNTLYDPNKNEYLIDQLEIQLITSTREIIERKERKAKQMAFERAVLIGNPSFDLDGITNGLVDDGASSHAVRSNLTLGTILSNRLLTPLPQTENEVNTIASLLHDKGWKTQLFVNDNALEEHIKSIKNVNVLHIATHGYFETRMNDKAAYNDLSFDPMFRSGLLLAGVNDYHASIQNSKTEDGILTAYESAHLQLDNNELVVLSACGTGLGSISSGEGVYGLQRGFKLAGSKSVVMSLWEVNDLTTKELMIEFYKEWIRTGNKFQAFRNAQLHTRKKYPKPVHWGGFVMVGENTLISVSDEWVDWLLPVTIILILAVVAFTNLNPFIIKKKLKLSSADINDG